MGGREGEGWVSEEEGVGYKISIRAELVGGGSGGGGGWRGGGGVGGVEEVGVPVKLKTKYRFFSGCPLQGGGSRLLISSPPCPHSSPPPPHSLPPPSPLCSHPHHAGLKAVGGWCGVGVS